MKSAKIQSKTITAIPRFYCSFDVNNMKQMHKIRYLLPLLIVIFLSFTFTEAIAQYENTSGQKEEVVYSLYDLA